MPTTKRKRRGGRRRGKKFGVFLLIIAGGGVLVVLGFSIYIFATLQQLPSPEQLSTRQISQSTKLYDRTGETLLYEIHGEEKRTVVSFEEIPLFVKQATIAAEDINFYNEPAFNFVSILRALVKNIAAGEVVQGGSTITQQLAKNAFLTPEKTIIRKIKELVLAIELETKYTKDEILYFYLNQIPYGSNAYGIEAASNIYFGKSVRDLSVAQAAVIAGLAKAPSYYSPWGSHVEELLERKDYVVTRMSEMGAIAVDDLEKIKGEVFVFSPPTLGAIHAPHFSLAVRDQLIDQFGEYLVTNGGLKVITTLDTKLQGIAERVVVEGVDRNEKLYASRNGALMAQDPKTGEILAMVGSRNYFDPEIDGNFNVVTQGLRQPGSALKPFVYLTAFERGFTPKTIVFDVETEFDVRNSPETSYKPNNFDDIFRGPISMGEALAQSVNVTAVKTLYLAGFDAVLKTLHDFGITTLKERWRYGLSLTLGGGEVKLFDLVNAYATLSQDCVRHNQSMILRVEDSKGVVIMENKDVSARVGEPQYCRTVTQILSDPELRSPIFQSSLPLTIFQDHDVALKTGTTEDYRDAWAFGYTPSLVVGVWAGNNDNAPMQRRGSSILAAVPIWNAFLKEALLLYPSEAFERPELSQTPTKPMLNGLSEFIPIINNVQYPHIHSILYYVDRNDPLGPMPTDPYGDSQFENWEKAVLLWARERITNFYTYNRALPAGVDVSQHIEEVARSGGINIDVVEPLGGSFVGSNFTIRANVTAPSGISKIELFFNRKLINGFGLSGDKTSYQYQYFFSGDLNPQNSFEIKATDKTGAQVKESLVVFK